MGPFETDRLILRNVEAADVPALKELIYSDREVWGQYSGLGDKPALLERAFANHVSQDDDAEFGRLAVVLKASGQTIGQVHLDPYVNIWYRVAGDPETPVSNIEVELAFAFGKAHWGQGYAFEACQALVDYASSSLAWSEAPNTRTTGPCACKSALGSMSMITKTRMRRAGQPGYRC